MLQLLTLGCLTLLSFEFAPFQGPRVQHFDEEPSALDPRREAVIETLHWTGSHGHTRWYDRSSGWLATALGAHAPSFPADVITSFHEEMRSRSAKDPRFLGDIAQEMAQEPRWSEVATFLLGNSLYTQILFLPIDASGRFGEAQIWRAVRALEHEGYPPGALNRLLLDAETPEIREQAQELDRVEWGTASAWEYMKWRGMRTLHERITDPGVVAGVLMGGAVNRMLPGGAGKVLPGQTWVRRLFGGSARASLPVFARWEAGVIAHAAVYSPEHTRPWAQDEATSGLAALTCAGFIELAPPALQRFRGLVPWMCRNAAKQAIHSARRSASPGLPALRPQTSPGPDLAAVARVTLANFLGFDVLETSKRFAVAVASATETTS